MRRTFILKILAASIATSVTAFGVAAASQPATRAHERVRLDGDTIFRGIFLGTGPVADVVPNAAGVPANIDAFIAELEPAILNHVQTAAPHFMERFGAAVQSGDPILVGRAVERGAVLFRAALADELKVENPDVAKVLQNLPSDRLRVGAIVAVAAVAAWVWIWFWTSDLPKPGDLSWEMLIGDITTEFAAS